MPNRFDRQSEKTFQKTDRLAESVLPGMPQSLGQVGGYESASEAQATVELSYMAAAELQRFRADMRARAARLGAEVGGADVIRVLEGPEE